jgi:hypothetical protein
MGNVGRPRRCPDEVLIMVVALRLDGLTLEAMSRQLNDAGAPTPRGRLPMVAISCF